MSINYFEKQLYKALLEDKKFYARSPDGKQISVFTDRDNYQDALKAGGYEAVDRDEAEAELAGQTGEKPQPKQTKIVADPFADKVNESKKPWIKQYNRLFESLDGK
tara:strand:+ start:1346 stop:1663 length:318 start_codon:yes stop_codon:yes gene_type:complete